MAQCCTYNYSLIKWTIVTLTLVGYIYYAVFIFIGIERNHAVVRNYELMKEQETFNKTYLNPVRSNASTGLSQFNGFYGKASRAAHLSCQIAQLDFTSWNNKTYNDAVWFSFSIVSTLGWGVYYPKSDTCRVICLVYAMLGVSLFAMLIGALRHWLRDAKECWFRRACIKCCGNQHMFGLARVLVALVFMFLHCYFWMRATALYYSLRGAHNETLGDRVKAAGYITEWNMIKELYQLWINILMLVGFGDMWEFDDHHFGYDLLQLCTLHLLMFVIIVFFIAQVACLLQSISDTIDGAINKKIANNDSSLINDSSPAAGRAQ